MTLPAQHRDALDIIANHFGGTITKGLDGWVASIGHATLLDLKDAGYLRQGLLTWSLTLKGWEAVTHG